MRVARSIALDIFEGTKAGLRILSRPDVVVWLAAGLVVILALQ